MSVSREGLLGNNSGALPSRVSESAANRLPDEEEVGEVTESLAEVLGNRGCVVLGYEVPDQPRPNAVVLINGNVVECVELVDMPDNEDSR